MRLSGSRNRLHMASPLLLLATLLAGCADVPRIDDATFSNRDGFCTRSCVANHASCMDLAWLHSSKNNCVSTLNMCVLSCPERQP
jgi:hypothetical protein